MSLRIPTKSTRNVPVPALRQTLDIVVLYTSVKLAAAALERAEELAQGMELRVRLVCTQIVPYPLPVEQPQVNLEHLKRELEKVSQRYSLEMLRRDCAGARYANGAEIGAKAEQYCCAGIAPPALADQRREPAERVHQSRP